MTNKEEVKITNALVMRAIEACMQGEEPSWGVLPDSYVLENVDGTEVVRPINIEPEIVYLHIHGGGFIGGNTNMHRAYALRLAEEVKEVNGKPFSIYSVNYRLAPQVGMYDIVEDVAAVYNHIMVCHPNAKIVVHGDSAGGTLSLSIVLKALQEGKPLPEVVTVDSPYTRARNEGMESRVFNAALDAILGKTSPLFPLLADPAHTKVGVTDINDPIVSPYFGDYKGFPSLYIKVGSYEVLLDDALEVYRKASKAGVDVSLTVCPNMSHDYSILMDASEESKAALRDTVDFITQRV